MLFAWFQATLRKSKCQYFSRKGILFASTKSRGATHRMLRSLASDSRLLIPPCHNKLKALEKSRAFSFNVWAGRDSNPRRPKPPDFMKPKDFSLARTISSPVLGALVSSLYGAPWPIAKVPTVFAYPPTGELSLHRYPREFIWKSPSKAAISTVRCNRPLYHLPTSS